jgi:hypothetical protein
MLFSPKSGLALLRWLTAAAFACCLFASTASAGSASGPGLEGPVSSPSITQTLDIPHEIVTIARREFAKGVREIPRGSNNSRGIARYRGALSPRPPAAAWCAFFASWVTRQAGAPLGAHGHGIASAAGIGIWARRTGRWRRVPRAGDVAVYIGHVGIVTSVRGSRMTTIEGNWSDRVSRLSRRRSEALGFARPVR